MTSELWSWTERLPKIMQYGELPLGKQSQHIQACIEPLKTDRDYCIQGLFKKFWIFFFFLIYLALSPSNYSLPLSQYTAPSAVATSGSSHGRLFFFF